MLGTDESIKRKIREAGEKTGERVWEMPLWEEYYDLIRSDIADMKNTGGRDGSVITAAALLSKFVQEYPWVHLDIAATAWTDKERPYTPKGATGIGMRLLTQFLRDYELSTSKTAKTNFRVKVANPRRNKIYRSLGLKSGSPILFRDGVLCPSRINRESFLSQNFYPIKPNLSILSN
jgi:hypothetical protein